MKQEVSIYNTLSALNLNDKVEKKKDMTYLSWTHAWAEVSKLYDDATYEVKMFNGMPFIHDEVTGYMVFTSVTIQGKTLEMWLPVMDGANKSMKSQSYTYATKYGDKLVEAATMFDINKTIMRCLVKNLAMFGLGIYIYAGDDVPDGEANHLVGSAKVVETVKELTLDSDNWKKVSRYASDNKSLGLEKILQQLERKYNISAEIKKELTKIINNG